MSVEQPASNLNPRGNQGPPRMASGILSFFLPSPLREPILGDLEEEFEQRVRTCKSVLEVYRWYWWQVLQSACLFIWQQRGTGMAYLISVIFFGLMMVLAVATSTYGLGLVSIPVMIALIPTSLMLGIGATSARAAKTAFKLSFSDADEQSPQLVSLACRFLHVTGNQFLLVAGVTFFLGAIQVLFIFSQNPELMDSPAYIARYGVAMLPLFYGLIFKCLFYSAEQKLLWKYAQV